MRAYMVYDTDPGEAAMLVFANTAQEARKISYGLGWHWGEGWTSWRANWIRDLPEHLAALDNGNPQVFDSPPTCDNCYSWGGHIVAGKGCSLCTEDFDQ